jgi:acyl-CoA thioesterase-1
MPQPQELLSTHLMCKYSLIRFTLTILITAYACFWHAAAASPAILVMGDSLSAAYGIDIDKGWVSLLDRKLKQRAYHYRVINASVSGETTSGGLERLPRALAQYKPSLVIIELGANDGLRGIDPHQIQKNLTRMIELSHQHRAEVLLIGMKIPINYGEAFRQRYYAVYKSVAGSTGVPLMPFFLRGVAQHSALMQEDGLHPNASAQPALLDNVWSKVKPLLTNARSVEN